jgi:hypothetical protein
LEKQVEELRDLVAFGQVEFDKKYREVIIDMYPQILDPEFDPKKKKQKVVFENYYFN